MKNDCYFWSGSSDRMKQARMLDPDLTININVSTVFAGQLRGVKQVTNSVWLVSFMHYDLGYFDAETVRLEPIKNPFRANVLPM